VSLLLHYKMNDNAANSTVADASGNGRHGTLYANTTPANTDTVDAAGKIGGALQFTATSNHNIIAPATTPAGTYAIALWVYFNSFGADGNAWVACQRTATSGASQNWQIIRYASDNNNLRLIHWTEANFFDTTLIVNPSLAAWYHVAAVVDASAHKTTPYVNGTAGTEVSFTGTPYNGASNLRIGCTGWGTPSLYLNALLDDFRIYDEALTAAKIQAIYNGGAGSEHPQPWFRPMWAAHQQQFLSGAA